MIWAVIVLTCIFFAGSYVSAPSDTSKNVDKQMIKFKAEKSNYLKKGTWWDENSQRCHMHISEKDNNILVEIQWGQSASEWYDWKLPCVYLPATGELAYKNGLLIHHDEISQEKGTVRYSNGSGKFLLKDDGFLYWQDDIENIGLRCKFKFLQD